MPPATGVFANPGRSRWPSRASRRVGKATASAAVPRRDQVLCDGRIAALARLSRRRAPGAGAAAGRLQPQPGGREGQGAGGALRRLRRQTVRGTAAGQGPDLFIFAHDRIGGWASAGHSIAPIDEFADSEVLQRFPEKLLGAMRYRGHLYGLPFNFKSTALIYNRALIAQPPVGSDEMIALARAHTDRKRGRFGLAYSYTEPFFHGALMNAFGPGPFDGNNRLALDSEANIRSLQLLADWARGTRCCRKSPTAPWSRSCSTRAARPW
ncbi:extracellular solute-binding protein [Microbulbifer taiwanensis]|uniref:extracellular solute-binding protein n=1 Tax=Microbulbifer taiwanensis TaxID=986746 RepID=UPI00360FC0C0